MLGRPKHGEATGGLFFFIILSAKSFSKRRVRSLSLLSTVSESLCRQSGAFSRQAKPLRFRGPRTQRVSSIPGEALMRKGGC